MLWWLAAAALGADLDLELVAEDFDLSADTERSLQRVLGRVAATWRSLGAAVPPDLRLDVRLIASEEEYRRREAEAMGRRGHTVGFFSTVPPRATVWRGTGEAAMRATLVHETSHFLMTAAGLGGAPRWLHEGMAELFEGARLDGNAVWLVPDPQMVDWVRGHPRPASALIGGDVAAWRSFGPTPWTLAEYPYGWAVCAFLMSSEPGKRTLSELLLRTAVSTDPAVARGAVEETWPGGAVALDREWMRWLADGPGRVQLPIATDAGTSEGWIRCADGSLIRADSGLVCGRWVKGPDGFSRFAPD